MNPLHLPNDQVVAPKRLVIRLTQVGEPARCLEFRPSCEQVEVLGTDPSVNVKVTGPGILPVHCYFEREGDTIWIAPAHRDVLVSVNYQPISGRVSIRGRSILSLGSTQFQLEVSESDDATPLHGPFGTEVLAERSSSAAIFETRPVDMQAILGHLATTSWEPVVHAVGEDAQAPDAVLGDTECEGAPALSKIPAARLDEIFRTQIIEIGPRASAASTTSPLAVVQPKPRVIFETQRFEPQRQATAQPSVEQGGAGAHAHETASWEHHSRTQLIPPVELPPLPAHASPIDPGSYTTTFEPIAGVFPDVHPAPAVGEQPSTAAQAGQLRRLPQRIKQLFRRKPSRAIVLAALMVLAVGLLAARVLGARRTASLNAAAADRSGSLSALPSGTSTNAARPAIPASAKRGPSAMVRTVRVGSSDPVAGEAAAHLLAGRQVEAQRAYCALAARYPNEAVYALAFKVLERRLGSSSEAPAPATEGGCYED